MFSLMKIKDVPSPLMILEGMIRYPGVSVIGEKSELISFTWNIINFNWKRQSPRVDSEAICQVSSRS